MKIRQGLLYLITVMTIFLALYIVEDYIIEYFNVELWIEITVFSCLNILVNPILTYVTVKKIQFLNNKW